MVFNCNISLKFSANSSVSDFSQADFFKNSKGIFYQSKKQAF